MPLVKITVIGRNGAHPAWVSVMGKFEIASDLGGSFCFYSLLLPEAPLRLAFTKEPQRQNGLIK